MSENDKSLEPNLNPPANNNTIRLFLWDVPSPDQEDAIDEKARGEVALIDWEGELPEFIIFATGFPDSPTFFRDKHSDVLRYTRIVKMTLPAAVEPSESD